MDTLDSIKQDYLNTALNHARMLVRLEKLIVGESFIEPRLDGSEDEAQKYLVKRHRARASKEERETRRAFYTEHFDIVDYSVEEPRDFDFPYDAHPQINVHIYLDGNWVRRCRNTDALSTLEQDLENMDDFVQPTKGMRFKTLNVQE